MNVAIIPARGNSVGIPGKNLKLLGNTPLIQWTLTAAKLSDCFEYIVVTSESDAILKVAIQNKVMAIVRPAWLSQNHVQTSEVCLDALRQLQMVNINPDIVTILQPTSPFRRMEDIRGAVDLYEKSHGVRTIISAYKSNKYHWHDNSPQYHNPEKRLGRQQERDMGMYVENGALYLCDADRFSRSGQYRIFPYGIYEMPENRSIDLDTLEEWNRATWMLENGLSG